MSEWWQTFFDEQYLAVWTPVLSEQRTAEEADALVSLLGIEGRARVLDAPCGYGRLTHVLAERGFDVLGVDASEPMIERARRSAGRFLCHDLRSPLAEGAFDAAFNVFSSIGYAGEDGDRAVLRTTAAALRPGGRFVLETLHRDPVVRRIASGGPPGTRFADGTLVVEELRFDPVAGRVDTTWHWSGPNGSGSKQASFRMYAIPELVAMLRDTGFRLLSVHDGLSTAAFRPQSPRIALLAERA
jgi:SAM-dependent methyltransferase